MLFVGEVVKYLESIGFEKIPCSTPLNRKNRIKVSIYKFLKSKFPSIFKKLVQFSPIEYKDNRKDYTIWFRLKGLPYESSIVMMMIPEYSVEYDLIWRTICSWEWSDTLFDKWIIKYANIPNFTDLSSFYNDNFPNQYIIDTYKPDSIIPLELYLSQFAELKPNIRERKLNLLDN